MADDKQFQRLKKTASGAANTLILLLLVAKKKDIHRGRDSMEHKKKQDCHHLCTCISQSTLSTVHDATLDGVQSRT